MLICYNPGLTQSVEMFAHNRHIKGKGAGCQRCAGAGE